MKKYLKYIIIVSIVIPLIIIDMVTKILAVSFLTVGESIPILGEYLKLDLIFNEAAGLSFGENLPDFVLPLLSFIFSGVFVFLLIKFGDFKKRPVGTVALCLMLAGTFGNLIDRTFDFPRVLYTGPIPDDLDQHGVVDFINTNQIFYDFGLSFGIWNFADSLLVIGTIALMVHIIFFDKDDKKAKKTKNDNEEESKEQELEINTKDDNPSEEINEDKIKSNEVNGND